MLAELVLLSLFACHGDGAEDSEAPAPVTCVPTERGVAEDAIVLRGTVRPPPAGDAWLSPRVAGTVVAVDVREGQTVHAGDVLVRLDDRTLSDAARDAEGAVRDAQATVDAATAAEARKSGLLERGIASKADAEAAHADAERARAALSSASAKLDAARADVSRARITSPIDGVVAQISARVGQQVDGGGALVEVVDPSRLEVDAVAPPDVLVKLSVGRPATVTSSGVTVDGTVGAVAAAVSPDSGLGAVRVDLSAVGLPVGAPGEARVVTARREDAVLVPSAAIRSVEDGSLAVVVCDGDHAKVVAVSVGSDVGDRTEVTSGLSGGEQVVADGGLGLDDGAAISPQTADRAAP